MTSILKNCLHISIIHNHARLFTYVSRPPYVPRWTDAPSIWRHLLTGPESFQEPIREESADSFSGYICHPCVMTAEDVRCFLWGSDLDPGKCTIRSPGSLAALSRATGEWPLTTPRWFSVCGGTACGRSRLLLSQSDARSCKGCRFGLKNTNGCNQQLIAIIFLGGKVLKCSRIFYVYCCESLWLTMFVSFLSAIFLFQHQIEPRARQEARSLQRNSKLTSVLTGWSAETVQKVPEP